MHLQACNPDGHANHKSDDSHEIEYEDITTTIKPSIAVQHVETTMKPSSEAVHSTEKAIIVLAETTNKTSPVVAEMVISTLTIVSSMRPAVDSLITTENPAQTIHEEVNKTSVTNPVEMTTVAAADMVTSTLTIVTSMTPAAISLNTTEQPPNIIHDEVNNTSVLTPIEMTTVAAHVITTENPGKLTPDMMATTTATIHVETSTHTTEEMNINKTTAAMMTISSMPMIITSPTVVRRERRQVNGTMKTATPPNTPVFGSRFSTRAPMPVTRNAGRGTTVGPATAGSRTTMKPKMVTKQPAQLSTTSKVRTPITMKPQPVTTGPVPVRG